MNVGHIDLPREFLPITGDEPDDHQRLRVLADYMEEQGQSLTANWLRWTANEWEWKRGMQLKDCETVIQVWARYSNVGWSRAEIAQVNCGVVTVTFTHRHNTESGFRAWWDLINRETGPHTGLKTKPKPRKGFSPTIVNVALARALLGPPPQPEPRLPHLILPGQLTLRLDAE